MARNSLVGSGQDMPVDMYLRKIEQTCMYEPVDLVENFHRATLKDLRPSPEFFESDQPRGGRDSNGNAFGNNLSSRMLDFRDSGFMNQQNAEPYLPDGSFVDHVFLERDPRGVALEPDMRKHVNQQYSRGSLYNYRPDNDDSVTESNITPGQMVYNIRSGQNISKDYLKIFDTSWDAWGTASATPGYTKSNVDLIENSAEIKDPSHLANRNNMNVTNSLSNDTSIGFRRTTDHVFQIEQYGKKNIGASFTDSNWYKNRANSHIDHDINMSWQDINVSKGLALTMMDLANRKDNALFTGLNNIDWGKSTDSRGVKQKLTPYDMAGMLSRPTENTQPKSAHTILNGEVTNTSGEKLLLHDPSVMEKTRINTTIFETMGRVNKNFKQLKTDDLRDAIQKTADDKGLYMEENNKTNATITNNEILWDSIANYKKGEEKTIVNYKSAVKNVRGHNLEKVGKFDFDTESYSTNQRRGRIDIKDTPKKNKSLYDNECGLELDKSKQTGPIGSKYMTAYMDRSGLENEINDL